MRKSIDTNEPTGTTEASPGADGVAFHGPVVAARGRRTTERIGIVVGAALLFAVGAVAVMGASSAPSTGADPAASSAPSASGAPDTTNPGRMGPGWAGPNGGVGRGGFRPGDFGPGEFGLGAHKGIGAGEISVKAIDGSAISLETADGWTRKITVTSTTTITKGGATIAVGDLAVGDHVRFAETKAADGTYTVTAIHVVLPAIAGQVTAVNGDTVTVTQPGGATATIHLGAGTTYQMNGATGARTEVKVDAFIVAEGVQRTDGSLDAAAVHIGGPRGLKGGFTGGPGDPGGPRDIDPAPDASTAPATQPG